MLLRDMYKELEELGGFSTNLEDLTEEQIDFLEENNEYDINLEELLDIIEDYRYSEFAEICAIYRDVEELAYQEISDVYNIPDTIMHYIDLKQFGEDLLDDEFYYELSSGEVVYISL